MRTAINIEECIFDRESYFNIKRFKLPRIDIDKVTKVIDLRGVNRKTFEKYKEISKFKFEKMLFEKSKLIRNPEIIKKIVQTEDDTIRNKHFGSADWIPQLAIPLTITFNPLKTLSLDIWTTYFDYYHSHSSILFVPNIRAWRIIVENNKKKKQWIIDVKDYLNFVDETVRILTYRNFKPVFVPISLKFKAKEKIIQILDHYLRSEYFNLWIDFEGSALSKNTIARLRIILRYLEEKGRFDDVVIYATNIRREIESNYKDIYTPASDPLTTVYGSNLLGGNREPMRRFELPPGISRPSELIRFHKSRILDPDTYYYIRADKVSNSILPRITVSREVITRDDFNKLINNHILTLELKEQSRHFLEEQSIKPYISQKEMVKTYDNGRLLTDLFKEYSTTKKQTSLDDLL